MLRAYLRFAIIMLNRNWKDDCTRRHRIAVVVRLLLLLRLVTQPPGAFVSQVQMEIIPPGSQGCGEN